MILVFDTETTGLTLHPDAPLSKQPFMIEFGAALLNGRGDVMEEHSFLVNPECSLEAVITKITGLTDADLVDAPTFQMVLPRLRTLFKKATCMVSHNLPFDKGILTYGLDRLHARDFPFPARGVCTVGLYSELYGRRPKLTELYANVMGKPLEQTHRALGDVMGLVDIIQRDKLWKHMQ